VDGRGIKEITINENGDLVVVYTDDTSTQPVNIKGPQGDAGTSIEITNIEQSQNSGEFSTVIFSDGKTLIIKNGQDGATGPEGP
jgi:hypothetical protein